MKLDSQFKNLSSCQASNALNVSKIEFIYMYEYYSAFSCSDNGKNMLSYDGLYLQNPRNYSQGAS